MDQGSDMEGGPTFSEGEKRPVGGAKGPSTGGIVLRSDLAEVSRARGFLSEVAGDAGFPPDRVFDITVASSEAVANAIEHAPVDGHVELRTSLCDDRLEVEVEGPGEFQTPDRLHERRTGGLGLPLMAKMADHLALYSGPQGGTMVELTFYREGHDQADVESPLPPGLLELVESNERLEALLDGVPAAFGILDSEWRWLYLNEEATQAGGLHETGVLGRPLAETRPDLVSSGFFDFLQEAKAQAKTLRREIRDPERARWVDATAFPFGEGVAYFTLQIKRSEQAEVGATAEVARLCEPQLGIAGALQLALFDIPSQIGDIRASHLYRSATEAAAVGGDFYDLFEGKDGAVVMLIGDVADQGIEAARTATLVKDVVRAFTHVTLRPEEVLQHTNSILIEKGTTSFVTLFVGILDSDSPRLRYASAGHPDVLIRRVSGEVVHLPANSAPLGVFTQAMWKARQVGLEEGDVVLLYTNGVTEARRGDDSFGEARLEELLRTDVPSIESLPTLILGRLVDFSGGALKDDVAVMALAFSEGG